MVVGNVVGALFFRQEADKVVPSVREQIRSTPWIIRPSQFKLPYREDATEDQATHTFGVGLRVGESEGGAPGAAKDRVPFRNIKVFP